MVQLTVPILGATQTSVQADPANSNSTLVQRDPAGGIAGKAVTGTQLTSSGAIQGGVATTQTSSFTAGLFDLTPCNATSGAITITMPMASANAGVTLAFYKTDSGGNAVTVSGGLGANATSTQYGMIIAKSDGTNWICK